MLNTFESNLPAQLPKTNRELDIELAKLIGYKTRPIQEGNGETKGRYLLQKPHCQGYFAGLTAIRSQVATQNHHEAEFNIGKDEVDAWKWVPEFTTNIDHNVTLQLYMRHSEKIFLSEDDYGTLGLRETIEFFIDEMKKKESNI